MLLQNLQAEFAETIFSDGELPEQVLLSHNMCIYQNNMMAHLIQSLKDTYPLIMKLTGDDFFRVTAKEYIRRYPSRRSNLHDFGEYFTDFIAEYGPVKNLIYLASVAQFEWASHTVFFAADHPELDLKRLEQLSSDQYDQLHFVLHPASQLIKFHYPLLRIIDLCKGEIDGTIDINEGGVNLLIIRRGIDIALVALTADDFTFLTALAENKSVLEAVEAATIIDANFKLDEKLPAWIRDKTIVDCYQSKPAC
jgi:hypothetical protein